MHDPPRQAFMLIILLVTLIVHVDQSTGGLTEHASKLSLSKGWHFNPVSPTCLKLGTHDLLLMGNKKVSRTHNVTSMDISRQRQFVNNLKKMTSNQPLIQLSVQCCVHV